VTLPDWEERANEGARHVEQWRKDPSVMPRLLGWFTAASAREVVLRRVLLGVRLHPVVLARVRRVIPGAARRQVWSSFVSRFAYWRDVRRGLTRSEWKSIARGVPVLLYHAFTDRDEESRFVVDRRAFRRQMRLLSLMRFDVISYEEFARTMRAGCLPPRRTVVLTIDDGYADNTDVLGELRELRFGATVFVVSGRLGGFNDWADTRPLLGRALMSAADVERVAEFGVEIGAHTSTHPLLPGLADDAVRRELEESKGDLERVLGRPVSVFAYPFGRFDDRTIEAVRRAGFLSACTTAPRLACLGDDPFLIPRIEIRGTDSSLRFLRKVCLGGA
jgi:peptidoglycan/xylan/chitin deacetylase (PgdA/CDA1 family)